jgi:excisionase family DNA binding protein
LGAAASPNAPGRIRWPIPAPPPDGIPKNAATCGIAEAAEFLACNPKKVRQLIASGELAGYRPGRVLRVRYSDLDAALPRVPCVPGSA